MVPRGSPSARVAGTEECYIKTRYVWLQSTVPVPTAANAEFQRESPLLRRLCSFIVYANILGDPKAYRYRLPSDKSW